MAVEWFSDLNPIVQALLSTTFTWFLTAKGAAAVFLFRNVNNRLGAIM